jgi:hypothetical protein
MNAMETKGELVEYLQSTHPNLTKAQDVSGVLEEVSASLIQGEDSDDEEEKKNKEDQ